MRSFWLDESPFLTLDAWRNGMGSQVLRYAHISLCLEVISQYESLLVGWWTFPLFPKFRMHGGTGAPSWRSQLLRYAHRSFYFDRNISKVDPPWTSSCQWLRFSFKMSILTLYNLLWGNLGHFCYWLLYNLLWGNLGYFCFHAVWVYPMLRILNYVHPFTLFMFMVFYDGLYDFKCMLIKI